MRGLSCTVGVFEGSRHGSSRSGIQPPSGVPVPGRDCYGTDQPLSPGNQRVVPGSHVRAVFLAANLIGGEGSAKRRPQRNTHGRTQASPAFSNMNDLWRGHIGGGWGIRTPEGFHPTRFPSVRHRPLGESSVAMEGFTRPTRTPS